MRDRSRAAVTDRDGSAGGPGPRPRQHLDAVPAGARVECPQCRTPLYRPRLRRAGGGCQGCTGVLEPEETR